MRKLLNGLLVSGLLAAAGHARAADLPVLTQHLLSEHAEVEAAQAAIDFCAAKKVGIHVVIVDSDGNVKLLIVGDGGRYNTVESARRKAYTSALMGQATEKIAQQIAVHPHMLLPPDDKMLFLGGGAPIRFGSTVIGAIGVGGGAPSQDQQCADAGVAKIELLLR